MLNRFSNRLFCKGLFFFLLLFAVVTCQVSAQQKQGNQNLPDLKVGKKAPAFSITDIAGNKVNLADYKGKIVVLEWNNPFCPFVVPHYESGNIPNMQKKYTQKNVAWLVINSTTDKHADYRNAEDMAKKVKAYSPGYTHYILDTDGNFGRRYGAKTTPHFFIIDAKGKLAYRGAIDNAQEMTDEKAEKVNYVQKALDELLDGKKVSIKQTKQYGCSVKYAKK